MRVLWGDPQPFTRQDLTPYIEVINQHVQQIVNREGINHMTITANETDTTVTLDTEDGTIIRLTNDWCLTAQVGALAVVDRSLTNVDQDRYLPVTWLTGHEADGHAQMDGGYNADTFEVFEFQVGDRVRVINSTFEFGYEGVISSIPATNGDDCVVAVDFPHYASMSYLFDRLEKVAAPDPLKEMRDALMRAFGAVQPKPEPAFEVGDRVTVNYGHEAWDGPATVTDVTDRIVVVETDRGDTGGFEFSEVEPLDEDDCCASYYEDDYDETEDYGYDEEPLAEWEKELLYGPRFEKDDVLVLVPGSERKDSHPDWNGLRVTVVSDEGEENIFVRPLEERPDGFDLGGFFWEREDFRPFDKATDFRVGDIVESERFGVDGKPAKAVVTDLDPALGGDIDVDWFEGNPALLAYGPIGARRIHLTLVGVSTEPQFESGQQVTADEIDSLPVGTVVVVHDGKLVIDYVPGEPA